MPRAADGPARLADASARGRAFGRAQEFSADAADTGGVALLMENMAEAAGSCVEDLDLERVARIVRGLDMFACEYHVVIHGLSSEQANGGVAQAGMLVQQVKVILDLSAAAPRRIRLGRGAA